MRQGIVKIILGLLLCAVSQAAAAQLVWDFVINDYPRSEENCEAQAQSLAGKLQKSYGTRLLKVACERGYSRESQKIVLRYMSRNGYQLEGINVVADHANGEYQDYASCRADLDLQVDLFRNYAGLEPLIAFCSAEHAPRLQIYYAGRPRMNRYALNVSLGGMGLSPTIDNPEEIAAAVRDGATRHGMNLSRVRVRGESYAHIALYYYATQPYRLGLYNKIAYQGMDECEGAAPEYMQLMQRLGTNEFYSFCAPATQSSDGAVARFFIGTIGSFGNTWLGEIELNSVGLDVFADYSTCMQNLETSLATFRQRSGQSAIAGICSLKSIEPIEYQTLIYY